jgi:hypothetical protein
MRRGSGTIAALIAVSVALAAPASATAKLLISTYNDGLEPHAKLSAQSPAIGHPKQLRVEVAGSSQAAVEGRFTVKCHRRGVPRFSREYTVSGISPATLVVPTSARWDSCRVTKASARFADPFISGWIEIRAWGTPR